MGDDLDHLLDEIEELFGKKDDESPEKIWTKNGKCISPCLGPPNANSSEKPCSALRCIRCDFAVLELPSAKWRPGTDYMFLRTNMPYAWKLSRQLQKCAGSIAYACQCCHFSTAELKSLKDVPSVQWTCGGHYRK